MRHLPRRVRIACGLLLVPAVEAAASSEPPEVPVCLPVSRVATEYADFTGRVTPSAEVEIRPRTDGPIVSVHFRAGQNVKEGDLLFTIDPRVFQAEVDRATALLRGAEARAKSAASELARTKRLHDNGTVTKEEFEQATARSEEALTGVQVARAALDLARLELQFTRVSAPVSGKVGRPLLDPGNFVKAGITPLATLVVTEPARAEFGVDERTFLELRRAVRGEKLGVRRVEDLPVFLRLSAEDDFPHRGKVESVSNHVEPSTGVIQFRAVFPNPDGDLVPGLFARVRIPVSTPREVLMIPGEAIRTLTGEEIGRGVRYAVYVVSDKNVVESRPVTFGPIAEDGLREVKEGLKAADRVIREVVKGVRPGQEVKPRLVPVPAKGK
jgi:RND family efflux transporter MFP subunit